MPGLNNNIWLFGRLKPSKDGRHYCLNCKWTLLCLHVYCL